MIKSIKGFFTGFNAPKPMNPNGRTQGAYDNMACCAGDPRTIACMDGTGGVAKTTKAPVDPNAGPLYPSAYLK